MKRRTGFTLQKQAEATLNAIERATAEEDKIDTEDLINIFALYRYELDALTGHENNDPYSLAKYVEYARALKYDTKQFNILYDFISCGITLYYELVKCRDSIIESPMDSEDLMKVIEYMYDKVAMLEPNKTTVTIFGPFEPHDTFHIITMVGKKNYFFSFIHIDTLRDFWKSYSIAMVHLAALRDDKNHQKESNENE